MVTILVLFVGLTLATAVIAYWSDNLGKKLGKKRVSLWGLRPRTTATFLTIASSWLIMIFTLGVMLTIFPPLRQSLLRYDEVKADVNVLKDSKTQLTGQVNGLNGQLVELRNQTGQLKAQVKDASNNLRDVRGKLEQSREAATNARKNAAAARKDADAARKNAGAALKRQQAAVGRETAARDNLKDVSAQLGTTKQQRARAQQDLKVAQNDVKRARADVRNADAKVGAANARVSNANAKFAQAEAQYEAQYKRAQSKLELVQTALNTARTNERAAIINAEAEGRNADESRRLAKVADDRAGRANKDRQDADRDALESLAVSTKATAEVREARKLVAELQAQSKNLQEANALALEVNSVIGAERDIVLASNIGVPVGFILVARTFEQGVSFTEATAELRALFNYAATDIVQGNAQKQRPALLPGAKLKLSERYVLAPNLEEGDEKAVVLVRDDDIYNGLADAISRSRTPLSVRLIAERNYLEGEETLKTRFIAVPVRSALPAGEELVRATLDPTAGDAQQFKALQRLSEVARQVAVQNGVAPPLWPDEDARNFYAPGTNEQIFQTLRKIGTFNNPVRVRIVTDRAISTADQLSVRFEVEPLTATAKTSAQTAGRKAPA